MAHKTNLHFLQQLKDKLGDDPAAGKIATVINEYRSLLDSRLEKRFFELGGEYNFMLLNGEQLRATVLEVGTYTILTGECGLIFKSAISLAVSAMQKADDA